MPSNEEGIAMSIYERRSGSESVTLLIAALLLSGCGAAAPADADEDWRRDMEARFTPGLHTLMVDVGMRHATVWFAGDAENWPLTDYLVHELEEVLDDIEELHPVYRDVQVAALLGEMTEPAMDSLEAAVEARDRAAFVQAYDGLTQACNHCHRAADRSALVIQRPTAPQVTNLRYEP
jgi:hypothetical protein